VAELLPALGCATLVLVPGLPDEPTGHVDLMVQFLRTDLVAVAEADPELEPEVAAALDQVVTGIEAAAAAHGRPLQTVRLPTTRAITGELHAYVNGLRLPGAFLLPSFAAQPKPAELRARAVLAAALPDVEIVRVPAAELTDLGGAVHCAAMGLVLPPATADSPAAASK
jgi:agmatine/peptidylarginine deiminase